MNMKKYTHDLGDSTVTLPKKSRGDPRDDITKPADARHPAHAKVTESGQLAPFAKVKGHVMKEKPPTITCHTCKRAFNRGLHGPGPGPQASAWAWSTDNVRVRAGFGPGSNDNNQT
jgi:hypothetical protein